MAGTNQKNIPKEFFGRWDETNVCNTYAYISEKSITPDSDWSDSTPEIVQPVGYG